MRTGSQPRAGWRASTISIQRSGFTLLEVMLASFLLTAGVGALLGTAVLTGRMVVRGRQAARLTQVGSAHLEGLRSAAATSPMNCAALSDGADSSTDGTAWQWRVESVGNLAKISVVVSVPVPGGRRSDSLDTALRCP